MIQRAGPPSSENLEYMPRRDHAIGRQVLGRRLEPQRQDGFPPGGDGQPPGLVFELSQKAAGIARRHPFHLADQDAAAIAALGHQIDLERLAVEPGSPPAAGWAPGLPAQAETGHAGACQLLPDLAHVMPELPADVLFHRLDLTGAEAGTVDLDLAKPEPQERIGDLVESALAAARLLRERQLAGDQVQIEQALEGAGQRRHRLAQPRSDLGDPVTALADEGEDRRRLGGVSHVVEQQARRLLAEDAQRAEEQGADGVPPQTA